MNLRKFISQTILATFQGVGDAIDAIDQGATVGSVNPFWIENEASWERSVQIIKFDVKIYSTEISGVEEIHVYDGAEHSSSVGYSDPATIQFSIPVIFPAQARHKKPTEELSP